MVEIVITEIFTFRIVRVISQIEGVEPIYKIIIKSGYILKACKDVIQSWPGISWNSDPLEVRRYFRIFESGFTIITFWNQLSPEIFITFHPHFIEYAETLKAQKKNRPEDIHIINSVNLLTSTIESNYPVTLATINRLISHCEITFDLIYAILIPRSIMVAHCAITGLPRLFELTSWQRVCVSGTPMYQLSLESVDLVDRVATRSVVVGRIQTTVCLRPVCGTVKIDSLDAYPIKFHPDEKGLCETIMKRGKKWVSLIGVHHKQYDGIAASKSNDNLTRHHVSVFFLKKVLGP